MGRRFDSVSFLSDLGLGSDTVGVVRAILRDAAPHASVIDLTHAVAPFDVRGGSLALARAIGYVPEGVVMASVDAATDRPQVAIEVASGAGVLIGPDNGLLAPAVAMAGGAERAVVLSDTGRHLATPGSVLAVRDVLAPVAAHLCNGVDLAELGDAVPVESLLPGVVPLPQAATDGAMVAEVLWVNHLGDCQLNIGADDLGADPDPLPGAVHHVRLVIGNGSDAVERVATWHGTLSPGPALGGGAIGVVVDPFGMVALVAGRRAAAAELGMGVGDQVTLRLIDPPVAVASPVSLRATRQA